MSSRSSNSSSFLDSERCNSDHWGFWSSCSVAVAATVEVTSGEAAPPSFLIRPTAQRLVEGGSVVFQCQVAGNPKPHIIWKKSGVPLTTGYRCETAFFAKSLEVPKLPTYCTSLYLRKASQELGVILDGGLI